ncbi:MAG: hypothetical protein RR291_03545, partial [Clostridia bacterium]
LENGFWTNHKEDNEVIATTALGSGWKKEQLKNRIYTGKDKTDDEIFYEKVVEILESDKIVTNPIALLLDEEKMETLTASERQTYIFTVACKYQKMQELYMSHNHAKQ